MRLSLFAVLCAALASTPATAQPASSQTLSGVVFDSTGAVMVSADVVVTSALGDRHTALTDASGRFEVRDLPRSTYRVAASAPGFAEAAQTVTIGDEAVPPVELILQLVIAEHVEVSTVVQLSATTGLMATTLTGAALEALPDDPGGLLQRVRQLAGATDDGQVIVTVDGFRQLLWMPPKQAIQAIRISSNWFAAEFAEPGQARIDIITKPGTDKVHGDLRANYNDEAINARNALARQHPVGNMRELTGYLSGPVIPRRLSFVAYRGYWSQQQNRVINATVLDPGYNTTSHVETVNTPSRVDNLWLGSTYQVHPSQTLAVSFSDTSERAANLGLDSGIDLLERAFRRSASDRAVRATLTSVPSNRALNELRLQVNPQRSTAQADSSAPAVMVLDAFNAGGNQEALYSSTRHSDVELIDSFTMFWSRHTLKAGIDARRVDRRYTDATNTGGIFLFGADFERDATGTPLEDAAGDRTVISPLENYRRTLFGWPGYGPSQFWMTHGNPDVAFRETLIGAFAQDDWMATPRVTFSYGLRSDWQTVTSEAGVGTRAGVAVAVDSARKNVIRAGAGTFYQRIEPELTLDVTRFDGSHQAQVVVDHPSFFPDVPGEIDAAATSQPTLYVTDGDLRAPQVLMSAASFERELSPSTFLTVKYSYERGTDLLRARSVNTPDSSGERPNPHFGRVLQYESSGRLWRHELTSGWRWNAGARGSMFANYSYIRGLSDTDGRTTIAADAAHLDDEFGPTAADRAHAANIGAHFTLPSAVSISPYLTAASGRVFNITTGLDNNADGIFTDRPAVVAPGTVGAIETAYGTFLADSADGAAIVTRNAGREPAMVRLDLRVSRAFRATAGSFVVAANVENVFNHANLEGVNGVVTSPSFGLAKRAASPRRVNFAASYSF